MLFFLRATAAASRVCGVAAAIMVLIATLVVCEMVFVRYVLNQSTVWQTEMATYLLIGAIFIGSPYVLLTKGHVYVDPVPLWVSPPVRRVMAFAAYGISLAFCALVAWKSWVFWHEAWSNDWHSETVWGIPLWRPYLSMPVGFTLLSLQYVADILAVATRRDTPFGLSDEERPLPGLAAEKGPAGHE